jgi:hypothetical protein
MPSSLQAFSNRPGEVINRARMEHGASKVVTLVVEGKNDKKFFSSWLQPGVARIQEVGGREYLMNILDALTDKESKWIHCIADIDYDFVSGCDRDSEKLTYISFNKKTRSIEANDLDAAVFQTGALNKVLRYKLEPEQQTQDFDLWVENLREKIRVAGNYIGSLRLADQKLNPRRAVYMRAFQIEQHPEIFDADKIEINQKKCRAVLLRGHDQQSVSRSEEFFEVASVEENRWCGTWALCRGHDLTSMLAMYLQQKTNRAYSRADLEGDLSLACEAAMISRMEFCKAIRSLTGFSGRRLFVI